MPLQSKADLLQRLSDKRFRESFVWSRITQTLAIQARVLRQKAKLTQQELADKIGTSQNAVFRMESPKYGNSSLATLKKWADFFDVGLVIRFAPLSEIVNWSQNLKSSSIDVPHYSHDTALAETDAEKEQAHVSVPVPEAHLRKCPIAYTAVAAPPGRPWIIVGRERHSDELENRLLESVRQGSGAASQDIPNIESGEGTWQRMNLERELLQKRVSQSSIS
jgi:transcriptional regulator with XRE-family HTH domain